MLLKTVKLAIVTNAIVGLFCIYFYFCIQGVKWLEHGISERYNRCR